MNENRRLYAIVSLLFSVFVFCASAGEAEMKTFSPAYGELMTMLENFRPENSIDVNIGTEFEEYKIGDPFEMRFMTSEACYIVLMNISSGGDITFITPSAVMPDNKVDGGRVYSTRSDFDMDIKVAAPEGIETINIFCSSEPLDLFHYDGEKEPLYTIKSSDEVRLTKLIENLKRLEQIDWSGNSVSFKITDPASTRRTRAIFRKRGGGALLPIGSTGTTGKFFPPIGTTGTTGKSENRPSNSEHE